VERFDLDPPAEERSLSRDQEPGQAPTVCLPVRFGMMVSSSSARPLPPWAIEGASAAVPVCDPPSWSMVTTQSIAD